MEATARQAQLQQRAAAHRRLRQLAGAVRAWRQGLEVLQHERRLQQRQEEQWAKVQLWLAEHRAGRAAAGEG